MASTVPARRRSATGWRRAVVRASVDDFHNPSAVRYRLGRDSAEGFVRDSFHTDALVDRLLAPFAQGSAFRRRLFDHHADARVLGADEHAPQDAVLLIDGLFMHRQALRDRWDLSILLDVPSDVAARRLQQRDGVPPAARYTQGQDRYFAACGPRSRATIVLPW
jgi:uridine kinase